MEDIIREVFGHKVVVGRTPPHCREDSERILDLVYADAIASGAILNLDGTGPKNAQCELYKKRNGKIKLRDLRPR